MPRDRAPAASVFAVPVPNDISLIPPPILWVVSLKAIVLAPDVPYPAGEPASPSGTKFAAMLARASDPLRPSVLRPRKKPTRTQALVVTKLPLLNLIVCAGVPVVMPTVAAEAAEVMAKPTIRINFFIGDI